MQDNDAQLVWLEKGEGGWFHDRLVDSYGLGAQNKGPVMTGLGTGSDEFVLCGWRLNFHHFDNG
jgi:hypothetical protein